MSDCYENMLLPKLSNKLILAEDRAEKLATVKRAKLAALRAVEVKYEECLEHKADAEAKLKALEKALKLLQEAVEAAMEAAGSDNDPDGAFLILKTASSKSKETP